MSAIQPETADTLPKLLLAQAARWGDRRVAIREKEFGIWQSHSWQDAARHVERIALGLASLGFRRGDKIAVIGDNRPQLYWTMFAAQALGGAPVPVYQDSIAAEMHYVIDHSESRMVICEDQEQVDKILEMKDKLPAVELVLYDDPKGMRHYDYPFLLSLDRVQELGLRFAAEHEGFWEAEAGKGRASDLAVINYTSGTTGFPKGVMISHGALISTARSFLEIEPLDERDEIMAYLPMAWIGDSFFSMAVACLAGCTVNCPEDASTVRQDFREIGPTMTFAPPAHLGEHPLAVPGAHRGRRPSPARPHEVFPAPRHAQGQARARRQARARQPSRLVRDRPLARLRAAARSARFPAHPLRHHRRGCSRAGDDAVLSRPRR